MNRLPNMVSAVLLAFAVLPPALAADVPAVIGWAQRVELGTLVSGVVSEVQVRPGQRVSKGDSLLSLDSRGFDSQVSRRLAEHRHAQAMLEEAEREDARAQELYDRTVLSDFERNQALIALKAARAAAEKARAGLVQARLDQERSVVRAPFDGVVLAVNAAPGQTVITELQSPALVTLADNRVYRARAQVDPEQAAQLEPGRRLSATVRGQTLDASVSYVGFEPVTQDGGTPRYELVTDIVAGGQALRVGETVTLHLE